jgi:hypothetical protein
MGTPNKVIADDWMDQDGNSLQLPSSPDGLLYELAYEYCTINWCLQNASDSLFSYENGFDFHFYENCNAAYPGSVTSEEASDELIARCEGNTACVTEGLIGGDEGTENALKVVAELEETRDRSNPKPLTPTPATSPLPTQQPQTPISTSAPVPTVVGNERCEDAMTLLVDGSTTSVSNSEFSHTQGTCGSTNYEGSVSWFTFIGTGRRVKISSCTDETDPTIDTYVAVFTSPSGSCGASDWTCVEENDNDESRCPEKPTASTLFLNSVAGQKYYVTVIGINNAAGSFGLLLTDESNGCDSAQNIFVDGTVTVGSNENGTSVGGICDREDYTPEDYHGLGVWYSFTGTGRRVKISTCTDKTDAGFDTYIAVYSSPGGTCNATDWTCVQENDNDASRCSSNPGSSTLFMNSVAGQTYYVVVIGSNNAIGNFGLLLTDESNGCNGAQNIFVDGTVTVGTNENGTTVGGICDREDYTPEDYHGLGIWYSFTGTGRQVKISTCTDETDAGFDTYIAVYSSTDSTSCDASDWNCISENDDSDASNCSTKPKSSTLLLDSIAGQKYDIVVIGNNNAIGTFGLILEDEGGELR